MFVALLASACCVTKEADMIKDLKYPKNEETLDPNNWEAISELGKEMVDDMMMHLKTLRERPVWQGVSEEAREFLNQKVPEEGTYAEDIYREFNEYILPYAKGNVHPRFWGWVEGNGTAIGMLAELLTAGMNSNLAFGNQGPAYVEEQAIDWCKEILGFPVDSRGILITGGSMANMIGVNVARNVHSPVDIRKVGLQGVSGRMTIYCSTETHNSIHKSIEMLGLGSDSIRYVPVDDKFRINVKALEELIEEDLLRGWIPFCIIGNAGTVNTGAFDDLEKLREVSRRRGMWFHVDGAFGSLVNLLPEAKHLVKGMSEADSLAFDLHKWLHMPYDVGCILIRNKEHMHNTYALDASYLMTHEKGLSAGPPPFKDRGPELSRGCRGLKVWMTIKEQGLGKFRNQIRQNIAQAFYLGELVMKTKELELTTPVTSNICCFRYVAKDQNKEFNNRLNKEILMELQERGVAIPSFTLLDGIYVIRVAITNHRSRKEDFTYLIEEVVKLGKELKNKI